MESKGYRIYWPNKRDIMVEQTVVFNENDICFQENIKTLLDELLVDGEK